MQALGHKIPMGQSDPWNVRGLATTTVSLLLGREAMHWADRQVQRTALGQIDPQRRISSPFHPALKGGNLNILEPWKHLVCPFELNRIAKTHGKKSTSFGGFDA